MEIGGTFDGGKGEVNSKIKREFGELEEDGIKNGKVLASDGS